MGPVWNIKAFLMAYVPLSPAAAYAPVAPSAAYAPVAPADPALAAPPHAAAKSKGKCRCQYLQFNKINELQYNDIPFYVQPRCEAGPNVPLWPRPRRTCPCPPAAPSRPVAPAMPYVPVAPFPPYVPVAPAPPYVTVAPPSRMRPWPRPRRTFPCPRPRRTCPWVCQFSRPIK